MTRQKKVNRVQCTRVHCTGITKYPSVYYKLSNMPGTGKGTVMDRETPSSTGIASFGTMSGDNTSINHPHQMRPQVQKYRAGNCFAHDVSHFFLRRYMCWLENFSSNNITQEMRISQNMLRLLELTWIIAHINSRFRIQ